MYGFFEGDKSKKAKGFLGKFFWTLLIVGSFVPFITYDTGIRCATQPCFEAVARGGLIEFLLKSPNFSAYIVDPSLFFIAFLLIYFVVGVVVKLTK